MADIQDDTSSTLENEVSAPTTTDDSNDTLLTLSFNQDGGCLAVGTAHGFRICNVSPYQETFRRSFDSRDGGGGIGSVAMLFRCNLLALVGGGTSPQYPTNKVLIWDDHIGRPIGELSFRQRVLAVRLRRDRICVAMKDRIYVYNFGDLALLDTIITGGEANGLGLLCISTDAGDSGDIGGGDDDGMVLACPSVQRGQVRVELYGLRKNVLIDAHESPLAAMALSVDGTLLATASERGTLIRLFETGKKAKDAFSSSIDSSSHPPAGTPLREFRRGVEHAKIGCLSFSLDKIWLACASDRETVHIFKIHEERQESTNGASNSTPPASPPKSKSSFSYASRYAKKILPSMLTKSPKRYLQGEQSFVQVRGGITRPQICAFVPDQPYTVAVAGLDDYGNGCMMLASFGEDSKSGGSHRQGNSSEDSKEMVRAVKGEAKRIAFHRFFKKSMDKIDRSKNYSNNNTGGNDEIVCSDEINNNRVDDLTKRVDLSSIGGGEKVGDGKDDSEYNDPNNISSAVDENVVQEAGASAADDDEPNAEGEGEQSAKTEENADAEPQNTSDP